jgi:hypothetical protein
MQFLNRRAIASYVLIISLVALMTGCGGGGSSSADKKAAVTVTQVQIFPNPSISLTPGQVTQVFAQALNSNGGQVFTQTITFSSSNSLIDITPTGGLCAGKWDSLTAPVVCTPIPSGSVPATTNVTASAGGVTSPTTVVSVHLPVTSVTVTPSGAPSPACVPEAGTQIFKAHAFNGATDITTTVGAFSWQSTQTSVATIPSGGDSGFTDQATATAVHPGDSNIIATIGTVTPITSTPVVFEQCLVASIDVSVGTPSSTTTPPEDATHFTVATGATRALTATVKDTTGATLATLPTLSWNTTHPAIAAVSGTGSVSGVAAGSVGISASCLPNNCNIGTNVNVTSNLVGGTVTGTPGTNATAYVTCTDPLPSPADATRTCTTPVTGGQQTQLFPINGTALGTAINLPHTPNSMMINPQNTKIYLGSTPNSNDLSAGLMVVDANANTVSATVTNAPGKVLAVAPNGNAVVVSNDADVFLYNGSTVQTLLNGTTHIVNAQAAAFSPDNGKLIVATSGGEVWFEVAGATPTLHTPGGSFVGAAFLPSGSLQAASAFGATQLFGIDPANTSAGSVGCGGLIQPLPNVDALYAANPGAGTVCVIDNTPTATPFSIGAFTANSVLIDPTGTLAYLVGGTTVKINTIGSTTVTPIALISGESATTGGIATNGTVYVGHSNGTASGSVHVISAGSAGTDSATPIATTIPADLVVAKH